MDSFKARTETDIRQLMKGSSDNVCAISPMFTWLAKEYLGVLISPIAKIT